jgi:hypothetical protein
MSYPGIFRHYLVAAVLALITAIAHAADTPSNSNTAIGIYLKSFCHAIAIGMASVQPGCRSVNQG